MADRRWSTPLGRFVAGYGAERLGHALGLSGRMPIYSWLRGSRRPRPDVALHIVHLARGKLSLADVYGVRAALDAKTAATVAPGTKIAGARDLRHGGKP